MPYVKALEDGMRKYSTFLYELERSGFEFFNFPYDMPNEYKPVFENRFITHYRYFQIASESPYMFRDWLCDKLNIVLPKYLRLYESIDIFSNPFINNVIENEQKIRNANRGKLYNTHEARGLAVYDGLNSGWSDNKGGSTNRDYLVNQNTERNIDKNKSILKSEQVQEFNEVKSNLFTDTPQNKNLKQEQAKMGKIINDKKPSPDITPDTPDTPEIENINQGVNNDQPANHEIWNDGYSTNATRDYANQGTFKGFKQGDGAVNYGTRRNAGESSGEQIGTAVNIARNINSATNKNNSLVKGNNYTVDIRVNENSLTNNQFGLKDKTLSSTLMEWRKTFINVDQMLLKEFRNCFLYIY